MMVPWAHQMATDLKHGAWVLGLIFLSVTHAPTPLETATAVHAVSVLTLRVYSVRLSTSMSPRY